jgi:hypothetical protein
MPFQKLQTDEERFWTKVEKTEGCWNWTGSKLPKGYGQFWFNGKRGYAHWFLLPTPLKKGQVARHSCDNPSCVRPDHILVGVQQDNVNDMMDRGRHNPTGMPGAVNPFAKLTDEHATLLRACPSTFGALTQLSKILGIHRSVAGKIKNRQAWNHLPEVTNEDREKVAELLKSQSKHGKEGTIASKMTEKEAKLAKACPKRYGAAMKMARAFGVSISAIGNIRDGKNWIHLPPSTPQDLANAEAFLASL